MTKIYSLFIFLLFTATSFSQNRPYIHSHNDYQQPVPFWSAFSANATSIEVDVFLKDQQLYVTHDEVDIVQDRTLESLYLKPLQEALKLGLGNENTIHLLIDVKSNSYKTLDAIVATLQKYPSLTNSALVSFSISGNRPRPEEYAKYPHYINFDYQSLNDTTKEAWEKVSLISLNFKNFSQWNGKGRLTKADKEKVINAIRKAHSYKKPFRFWGAPDSKTAWKAFTDLGLDFINTDHPFTCVPYVRTLEERTYRNTDFSKIYRPTFKYDQTTEPVKNVILLIGDGNGLSQISATILANKGELTLTQLKSIGLIKTQSSDDFTTDSAAAGTALATGEKTYNRAIGLDSLQNPIKNIAEILQDHNYNTGIITTDNVTGATPSAFYAHQKDRDDTNEITQDLINSKLNLFAGGGKNKFNDFNDFKIVTSVEAIGQSKNDKIGFFMAEEEVPSVLKGRGNILAEATKYGLQYFKAKKQPFFLMVEGAQIDSYGHANNTGGIITEGIDFDKAIAQAIQFADENPNTLVIITADHETSGFSIPQGNVSKNEIEGDFGTHDHTGTLVPIFAYGPHSNQFTGVFNNNDVFHKILDLLKNVKQ